MPNSRYLRGLPFNRTKLELKLLTWSLGQRAPGTFNRTKLELKLAEACFSLSKTAAFNRTKLELKRDSLFFYLGIAAPLIAPSWN